ncbi:MAG TPA: hypothetical protein VNI77_01330, partial [Nitrososphaera sp.]|nr:hypothetical protein [Nitrososphaera sp.]
MQDKASTRILALAVVAAIAVASLPYPSSMYEAAAAAERDKFGVEMLYPTKPGGDEWFMDMDDPNGDEDRFTTKDEITKNSDGSWKVEDGQIRMNVFTRSGYDPEEIETYDQDVLATKGYMQDPNDWKDVEITGYVK